MDDMEQVQSAVESAWTEEESPVQETEAEAAPPADQPEGEQKETQAQPAAEEQQADQPELFTIKNRDETRQVTREQLVAMAQKGLDYDTVREERDQLRQYRQDADPALELVRSYAQRNGMTVGDYLDYCRKQELVAGGMTEQAASERVNLEKERADLNRQRAEIEAHQQRQTSVLQRAKEQSQARQKDIESFYRAYPNVDPKSIPPEVWASVRSGETLTNAYTMHENRRLKAELAAEQKNKKNAAATPGSLGGETADSKASLIAKYWDEAD